MALHHPQKESTAFFSVRSLCVESNGLAPYNGAQAPPPLHRRQLPDCPSLVKTPPPQPWNPPAAIVDFFSFFPPSLVNQSPQLGSKKRTRTASDCARVRCPRGCRNIVSSPPSLPNIHIEWLQKETSVFQSTLSLVQNGSSTACRPRFNVPSLRVVYGGPCTPSSPTLWREASTTTPHPRRDAIVEIESPSMNDESKDALAVFMRPF